MKGQMMGDISLSLRPVLLGVLLIVLVLLLLMMVARRRRGGAPSTPPLPTSEAAEDTLHASSDDVAREHRELTDPVLTSARGSRGRHAAVPAAPASALMILVPVAAKWRHRPADITSRPLPVPAESIAVPEVSAGECQHDDAVAAAAQEMRTYQRRVAATVQAVSHRIEPGDSPEVVEARMLAALARLDDPLDFVRPRLSPSGPHVGAGRLDVAPRHVSRVAPPLSSPPAVEQAVTEAPPKVEPAPSLDSGPTVQENEPEQRVPEEPVPEEPGSGAGPAQGPTRDEPEVVLPVPPLPSSPPARRRGMRARGKTS